MRRSAANYLTRTNRTIRYVACCRVNPYPSLLFSLAQLSLKSRPPIRRIRCPTSWTRSARRRRSLTRHTATERRRSRWALLKIRAKKNGVKPRILLWRNSRVWRTVVRSWRPTSRCTYLVLSSMSHKTQEAHERPLPKSALARR